MDNISLNVDDTPGSAMNMNDHELWTARPSQIPNVVRLVTYLIVLAVIIACLGLAIDTNLFQQYLTSIVPYILPAYGAIAALMALKVVYSFLATHYTIYELTSQRFIETSGITQMFAKPKTLELYHVIDYGFPPKGIKALIGLGDLELVTTDADQPLVRMKAIKNREAAYKLIRNTVESIRMDKKGYFVN